MKGSNPMLTIKVFCRMFTLILFEDPESVIKNTIF